MCIRDSFIGALSSKIKNRPRQDDYKNTRNLYKVFKMEHTGLEPVASTLPVWRAPNCANAPNQKLNPKKIITQAVEFGNPIYTLILL